MKVMFVDKNKTVSLCFEKTLRKNVSETLGTTSLRERDLVRTREPASFWRENVIASVILLRVLARMS